MGARKRIKADEMKKARKTIAFAPNNLAPTDMEIPWFPALAVTKVTPLKVFFKFSNDTNSSDPKRE